MRGRGVLAGVSQRLDGLPGRTAGRLRDAAWRIALAAATASVAWVVAQQLLGQRAPIFAPIAAVVCLTDSAEVRGRRAVRLLGGVCVGVVVGEFAGRAVGTGWLQIAVALALGTLIVALASINPLTLLQSGIAVLLVVGLSSPQAGWTRLASAVIGGVLALVVSQVLAAPSPVRLLATAARTALGPPVAALEEAAAALREGSAARARDAAEALRRGHESLSAFLDTRSAADRIAAATLRGRRERSRVRELQRRFRGVEYVYAGSVLLLRTATELAESGQRVPEHLVAGVEDLAAALRAVAHDPVAADPVATDPVACGPSADDDHAAGRSRAHELADELARTDPREHVEGPAQLATQLHLLASDVAELTEPVASVVHV